MAEEFVPVEPRSPEETGLTLLFLSELALKILYIGGQMTGFELAQEMRLPFPGVVIKIIDFLKREHYCETRGTGGLGEGSYQYSTTDRGAAKAREILWKNQYAGPAPVPMSAYRRAVATQGPPRPDLTPEDLQAALSGLVLSPELLDEVGPAIVSRHSLLLYGASGNGKSAVALGLAASLRKGEIYIPYAIEAGGELILLYDDALHEIAEESGDNGGMQGKRVDNRWIRIRRPVITLGAELRLNALDPYYDEVSRYYMAPPQVKVNGGVLIMDDLGRQSVPASEFLNRWMVPMDRRSDHLSLRTGRKLEVPFEAVVIFATHLAPTELADEAVLRRIRHKAELHSPTFDTYREIFRQACGDRGIPYDEESLAYLLQKYYVGPKRPMRASHPDEILSGLVDIALYQRRPAVLDRDLLDRACHAYFAQS